MLTHDVVVELLGARPRERRPPRRRGSCGRRRSARSGLDRAARTSQRQHQHRAQPLAERFRLESAASSAPITSPGSSELDDGRRRAPPPRTAELLEPRHLGRSELLVGELLRRDGHATTPTPPRSSPRQPRDDPPTQARSPPTPRSAGCRPRPPRRGVGSPVAPSRRGPVPNPPRRRDTSVWSVCEALAGGTSPQSASISRSDDTTSLASTARYRQYPPLLADCRASPAPHPRITSSGPSTTATTESDRTPDLRLHLRTRSGRASERPATNRDGAARPSTTLQSRNQSSHTKPRRRP